MFIKLIIFQEFQKFINEKFPNLHEIPIIKNYKKDFFLIIIYG